MTRLQRSKRKGAVTTGDRRKGRQMGSTIAATAFGAFAMTAQTPSSPAQASIAPQEREGLVKTYRIPPGTVANALNELADQNGIHVLYPADATRGLRTPGLAGSYSLPSALNQLLSGTGLKYRLDKNGHAISIALAQNNNGSRTDAAPAGAEALPTIDIGAAQPVPAGLEARGKERAREYRGRGMERAPGAMAARDWRRIPITTLTSCPTPASAPGPTRRSWRRP